MKSVILFILFIAAFESFQKVERSNTTTLLCGKTCKLWHARTGYSLEFCSDYTLTEFKKSGDSLTLVNYEDLIVDSLNWKTENDTIYTFAGKVLLNKYRIFSMSDSSLVLIANKENWGKDTLVYSRW